MAKKLSEVINLKYVYNYGNVQYTDIVGALLIIILNLVYGLDYVKRLNCFIILLDIK